MNSTKTLIVCLFVLLAFSGCQTTTLSQQPIVGSSLPQQFVINDSPYRFEIPGGGSIGQYNRFKLNTESLEKDQQILFSWSYDRINSSKRWHSLSHYLFGVIRNGHCGFACAPPPEDRQNGNLTQTTIAGSPAYNWSNNSQNGDYVEMYYLPLNEEFSIFFTLRIDRMKAQDNKWRASRSKMLKATVASFSQDLSPI